MHTTLSPAAALARAAAVAGALLAGCAADPAAEPPLDPAADRPPAAAPTAEDTARRTLSSSLAVTPLPCFAATPHIAQASGALGDLRVTAVARTQSGFQIYRCEQGATAPEWRLRTPLAMLEPSSTVQRPSLNSARLGELVAGYHYRSDFGGLLSSAQTGTLGLASPPVNAPVWDFTFQASGEAPRHEVVAARVLAQDAPDAASIAYLLLEVRGRAVDPGTPRAPAAATHMLRWDTHGGLAPPAASCDAAALGREVQSPYAADYYFLAPAS